METKDSNGNLLQNGDSVHLVKDLKVKGSSSTLKREVKIKNIKLTDDPTEVECRVEGSVIVLKTEFIKRYKKSGYLQLILPIKNLPIFPILIFQLN